VIVVDHLGGRWFRATTVGASRNLMLSEPWENDGSTSVTRKRDADKNCLYATDESIAKPVRTPVRRPYSDVGKAARPVNRATIEGSTDQDVVCS